MKNVLVSALTAAVVGACFYAIGPLLAARNSSGSMTAANGPYLAGQVIDQTLVNARLADIENEITDSYSRSGKGKMTTDGTVSTPAFSWNSESGSGLYRAGSGDIRMSISNTDVVKYATTGLTLPGTSQTLTLSGASAKVGIGGAAVTFPFEVRTAVGTTNAQFGTTAPAYLVDGGGLGLNLYYDGANWKYGATAAGANLNVDTAGGFIIYTTPSGTAGTAATLTERARINVNGLTIGSGGTAISKSLRGTTVWNPGTVASNTAATAGMTITGAVAGADCVAGVVDPSPLTGYPVQCITTTNNCNIAIRNQQNTGFTFGSATFYCRVFNP